MDTTEHYKGGLAVTLYQQILSKRECIEKELMRIHEKLQELINQNSYIFNTPVSLVFESREETCQIAGVVNNHIITMDNKIIKINELKDIKILK